MSSFTGAVTGSAAGAFADTVCGWSLHGRLLRLETPAGCAALLAERLVADEAVGDGFVLRVDALADAEADIDALLGLELGVHLRQADGEERRWFGLAVETTRVGRAGPGVRWRLELRPWTVLLQRRHDCVRHEDMTAAEILERVFRAVAGACWRLDLSREPARRASCTQYAETDWAFCTRLMAEEGWSWHFEALGAAEAESARWRHRLVVADEGATRVDLGAARFAAEHPTAVLPGQHDAVSAWAEHRLAAPARVTVGSWAPGGRGGHAACRESETAPGPRLEHYDGLGLERFSDRQGAADGAERRLRHFELRRHLVQGGGSVRHLAAGAVFTLQDLPGAPRRLLLLRVHHEAANALGPGLARMLADADLEAGRYRNRFDAVPAELSVAPPAPRRPAAPGLQTATVVGVEQAWPMADGALRVKLRHAWQAEAGVDTAADGVVQQPWPLRQPAGRRGGAWVRVVQPAAGSGWGAAFVPRVGAEVLVGHLDGDLDRPVVLGALFNGHDRPPYAGSALSGVLGACLTPGGGASAEWVLDDTTGQLRTRLASLPLAAELGLGWLVTQGSGSASRGAARGAGFEAATAGRVTLRAAGGLLLATHARHARGGSCEGSQMDAAEAVARLDRAQASTAALQRGWHAAPCPWPMALDAGGVFAAGLQALQRLEAAPPGGPAAPQAADAWLALASGATLALSSGAEIVHTAAADLAGVAGADSHESAGHDAALVAGAAVQLLAGTGDARLVAACGDAAVRAHGGTLALRARGAVRVQAQGGELRLVARRRLVLRGAGSSIVLDGADVHVTTPGTLTLAAAAHRFPGPGRVQAPRPALPQQCLQAQPNWIEIDHHDADGRAFAGQRYVIHFEGGGTVEGRLDAQGHARHEAVPERVVRVDYEPREPLAAAPWPPLSELVEALRARLG